MYKIGLGEDEFDSERYKDVLDVIDTYRCLLYLEGTEHLFSISKTDKDIYCANLSSFVIGKTGVTKGKGFAIHFCQKKPDVVCCMFVITMGVFVADFNPRSISAKLRGKLHKWNKTISGSQHIYEIPFSTPEELKIIFQIFYPFLP